MKKIQHDFSHTNISEALKRVKKSKYKRVHQNNFFTTTLRTVRIPCDT